MVDEPRPRPRESLVRVSGLNQVDDVCRAANALGLGASYQPDRDMACMETS